MFVLLSTPALSGEPIKFEKPAMQDLQARVLRYLRQQLRLRRLPCQRDGAPESRSQ